MTPLHVEDLLAAIMVARATLRNEALGEKQDVEVVVATAKEESDSEMDVADIHAIGEQLASLGRELLRGPGSFAFRKP